MLKNTKGGWPLKPLSDVVDFNPRLDKSAYPDDLEVSFVPMAAVSAGSGHIEVSQSKHFSKVKKGYTPFQENDVLFAKITPCMENGKMAVVPKLSNGLGFGSTEFHVLRPHEGIDSRYIYYFVSSQSFRREAAHRMTGAVGQKRVPLPFLEETFIPVPAFDDQKCIVAEIEKQFSRLDEAVVNLKRIKANLKRYKAAVLKAAVEGKLTEEWRLSARAEDRRRAQASELVAIPKAGKDKWFVYIIECDGGSYYVGHTGDLHDRWQRHCEGSAADWTHQHVPKYLVHYEACGSREEAVKREKDLKTGFGRTWRKREIDAGRIKPLVHNPENDTAQPVHDEDMQTGTKLLDRILAERRAKWKGKGKYKEPQAPCTADLPPLPKDWGWASPAQVSSSEPYSLAIGPFGSNLKVSDYRDSGVPLIFVRNIRSLDFGDEGRVFVSKRKAAELKAHGVSGGDVIITKMGDPPGDACLYPELAADAIITADCIKLRLSRILPEKRYIVHAINAEIVKTQILSITKGVAQLKVSLARFGGIGISLPPLAEQEQIVSQIERRLSMIDELEASVDSNLSRADRLRQSILTKAFSGQLVKPNSSLPSKIA